MKLYHNATILTQDPSLPTAKAMVVDGESIVAVSHDQAALRRSYPQAEHIDLDGKTVLPGFNDAHIHVWKVGQLESFIIDLRGVKSIVELQHKVKAVADTLPAGTWITGRGFNEQVLDEKRMPVKEDLDAISAYHPIYLIRTCAHIASVNSLAISHARVTSSTKAPDGGVVGKRDNGDLTGIFYETALGLITKHIPAPSLNDYRRMIKTGEAKLFSYGITSATDPAVHPELLEAYLDLDTRGDIALRFNLMPILLPDGGDAPYPIPPRYSSTKIDVHTVKFFSDGGLSGQTASLKRPYKNSDNKGVSRLQYDQFLTLAREAQQQGYRIGTHAIGDAAIDLVLEVYKTLHHEFGDTRNRIEHFGLPSNENIDDVARFGFLPIPQAIFLEELGENFIKALDEEYLNRCYPIRSLLDKNIPVAFSTDAPVVKTINPWSCIKSSVTRQTSAGNVIAKHEAVTVAEALYGYTMSSAYADGHEKRKGSITPGKVADFIVVDKNPLLVPVEDLDTIKVEATFVGGTCVYGALTSAQSL